jgi:spore maturation protein CgeB
MRVVLFCHSLISDWNNDDAHFLRGIVSELLARGIDAAVYEPRRAWSVEHLVKERGSAAIAGFHRAYPMLRSIRYGPGDPELDRALDGADLVLVHEWNDPELIQRLGEHRRRRGRYQLLFHDTSHRSAVAPAEMAAHLLEGYDGVLASGRAIGDLYRANRWARRVWVWHQAADVRRFHPLPRITVEGDLVWIGNGGDGDRSAELREFLIRPVRALGLQARVHGVWDSAAAQAELGASGIEYAGWLPNYEVPRVFSRHRVTVHIPPGPFARPLPGVPTIRVFEALACGIPLVSAPWGNAEDLFTPGEDFLLARDGAEMREQLALMLSDPQRAAGLASHGFRTIRERHTCAHRVDELLAIYAQLSPPRGGVAA